MTCEMTLIELQESSQSTQWQADTYFCSFFYTITTTPSLICSKYINSMQEGCLSTPKHYFCTRAFITRHKMQFSDILQPHANFVQKTKRRTIYSHFSHRPSTPHFSGKTTFRVNAQNMPPSPRQLNFHSSFEKRIQWHTGEVENNEIQKKKARKRLLRKSCNSAKAENKIP